VHPTRPVHDGPVSGSPPAAPALEAIAVTHNTDHLRCRTLIMGSIEVRGDAKRLDKRNVAIKFDFLVPKKVGSRIVTRETRLEKFNEAIDAAPIHAVVVDGIWVIARPD